MHVNIFGKRYKLRFVRLRKNDGDCSDPHEPGREIRVCTGASEKRQLEVIVHELLHAADWWKDEKWVESVARDITNILWRLGYRKQKDLDKLSPK